MNLLSFDLNLLKVLDALLREGSTVRAGEAVGLSQPAVSAALARLRHALKDPLFVRHGQGLRATDFARSLEVPLRATFDHLDTLLAGPAAFDPARASHGFRISGSDFFSELLMPTLGEYLMRNAPGIRVQQVNTVPDDYLEMIETDSVDLALVPNSRTPSWIKGEFLLRSDFMVIARSDNARLRRAGVAPGGEVPIDLFCDMPQVAFSPEGNSRTMGDFALEKLGRSRRVAMSVPTFSGVYHAVAEGDLIALIPHQMAEKAARWLEISVYRPGFAISPVDIHMYWHGRHDTSAAHIWLRRVVRGLIGPGRAENPDNLRG